MAFFGIETDHEEKVINFIRKVNLNLKDKNYLKNPFFGGIRRTGFYGRKIKFLVSMTPIYFNFAPYCLATTAFIYIINDFTFHWGLWFGIGLGAMGIFWSKYFFIFFFKKGLRKEGYKGVIRILKVNGGQLKRLKIIY